MIIDESCPGAPRERVYRMLMETDIRVAGAMARGGRRRRSRDLRREGDRVTRGRKIQISVELQRHLASGTPEPCA